MVLCKICGTVYDEFYGLCPKCGTPYEPEDNAPDSLPPIGKTALPKAAVPGALPSIEDAMRNSGDADNDATLPIGILPLDPDATIPMSKPALDPDATIPMSKPALDPDATIPMSKPALDPDATIPMSKPVLDPDATVPLGAQNRTFNADPDATVPLGAQNRTFNADPDATVPLGAQSRTFNADPDATVPLGAQNRKFNADPDATVPLGAQNRTFNADPDATVPLGAQSRTFNADPDATVPLGAQNRTFNADPDATVPLGAQNRTFNADPDATVPLGAQNRTFNADPDATVPLGVQGRKFSAEPDATLPLTQPGKNISPEPDATVPLGRQSVYPAVSADPKGQTKEVVMPSNAVRAPYGDNYDDPSAQTAAQSRKAPVRRKSSAGKIAAIILIIAVILAGCGVGAYFLFIKPSQTPQTNVEELVSQGDKYYSEGKTDDAIKSYTQAIEAKPDDAQLYIRLADIYLAKGDKENAAATLNAGYEKTNSQDIKNKLDQISGTGDNDDPDTMRKYARSLNMAVLNMYAAVTSGDLNASSPSDKLNGVAPSRLPAAGASADDRENAANALTVSDVITYSGMTEKITASNIGTFVYEGAQIYYGADHTGSQLAFSTTVGEIRGAVPEESSAPESSQESSEPQASVITDPLVIEAELEDACKSLYAGVIDGTISQNTPADELHGLPTSKLPKNNASAKARKRYAEALTVADAITYGELGSSVDGLNIIDYNYDSGEITYRGSGTPMTLDTFLGDIMKVSEPSEESSKPEESSAPQTEYDKKYVGQWKSVFNTAAYSAEQIKEFKEQLGWDEYNILLSDSGTASAYGVKDNITDISGTGTWKSEGDKLVVTIDGDAVEFKYNNGRLTTDVLINAVFFEKSYNPGTDPQPSQEPEPSETSQESSQASEPSQNTVELPDVPSDAFGVICFEVPEDWDENNLSIRVFDYDGNKNENNSKLTFYSDGVYAYTVNKYSSTNYLFNNPKFIIISATKDSGKIVQTEEIYVSRGSKLYTAEKQGRKYVLTEK